VSISDTLIPPSFGSLDAPGSSSPRWNRLSVTTDNGADRGRGNTEGPNVDTHEQGTPGQQPSAVLDPSMSTAQPVLLSPKLAPPSGGTGTEGARFPHSLSTLAVVSGHYPTICANPPDH